MSNLVMLQSDALVDTIRFEVVVQKTVVQEKVKITVRANALTQTRDADIGVIESRIREALKKFIDARWEFSDLKRSADAVGYERIQLTAWTLVHGKENYNLNERARLASSEGLTISDPSVDYSLPPAMVGSILKELGEETLNLINDRIAAYNRVTGRQWRLGDLEFNSQERRSEYDNPKAAYFEEREESALMRAGIVKLRSKVTLKSNAELAMAS